MDNIQSETVIKSSISLLCCTYVKLTASLLFVIVLLLLKFTKRKA